LRVLRGRSSVGTSLGAGVAALATTIGSYPIGGLVLAIPASLLIAAAGLRYLTTTELIGGSKPSRRRLRLVAGGIIGSAGTYLSLSYSPLTFVGWLLLIVAIALVGNVLSEGHRGGRRALAWFVAVIGVLGLQALTLTLVISIAASSSAGAREPYPSPGSRQPSGCSGYRPSPGPWPCR